MGVDKAIKKKVNEDWQAAFPELTSYSQNKLYKIVGPCILGLELITLPFTPEYRPHFVLYPLWESDAKSSLDRPIFMVEFKNRRNFQLDIPYGKHNDLFGEAADNTRRQTPLAFEGDISFNQITAAIVNVSKTQPLSAAPHSYFQAKLCEAKLKIALVTRVIEVPQILKEINQRKWDTNHFKACGMDVSEWLRGLQETIANREGFVERIDANKLDKKLMKLKNSELTE